MKIYENLDINDLENEIWKVITDFPDYQVSNLGRVKSLKFGKEKILKQWKDTKNYLCVNFCKNNKRKVKRIHRLIYETFVRKIKKDYDIHHIDEDTENNLITNLKMKTDLNHRSFHSRNEKNSNHKLSNQDVFDVKKSLKLKLYTPKQQIKNKKLWRVNERV